MTRRKDLKDRINKPAEVRKALILAATIALARKRGYNRITRREIAEAAGVAPSLLYAHFGDMATLREALVIFAIAENDLTLIGQALVARHPRALALDAKTRAAAARHIASA